MDAVALLKTLTRHRLIVIPAILLVVLGLFATYKLAPPRYRSTASVVMLPPPPIPSTNQLSESQIEALQAQAYNPFAEYNDLSVVANLLSQILQSKPVNHTLHQEGVTGTYTASVNLVNYQGPVLDVVTQSPSAAASQRSAELIVQEAALQLREHQVSFGTAPKYWITTSPIVMPEPGTRVFSSTLRRLIGAGVVGIIFVISVGVGSESLAQRRRRKAGPLHATDGGSTGAATRSDGNPPVGSFAGFVQHDADSQSAWRAWERDARASVDARLEELEQDLDDLKALDTVRPDPAPVDGPARPQIERAESRTAPLWK